MFGNDYFMLQLSLLFDFEIHEVTSHTDYFYLEL